MLRKQVLSCFKNLHKTRKQVFKNDDTALREARKRINEEFKTHKTEENAEKVQELLKVGIDSEFLLRTTVIQAKLTPDGNYEEQRVSMEEKKLVLAYDELEEIPENLIEKYASWIEVLDLSHNHIRNPQCLFKFSKLTTLILDHNDLASDSRFPGLPNLHTLWINNNNISELGAFISRLARSAPNLKYLSMMKNPATPCSFGEVSFTQYEMYRFFVIFYFTKLEHLDDVRVSFTERQEAAKRFNNLKILQLLLPITPKFPLDRENKIV